MISEKNRGEQMGGYGSGRKTEIKTTEDTLSIDIRRWQRDGFLVNGTSFTCKWSKRGKVIGSISVKIEPELAKISYYSAPKDKQTYPIKLQTTHCHYGGERYWFTCPTSGCNKRAALLYLNNHYFACRHCHKLAYPSQREPDWDRAARQVDKLREKLEWEPGFLNGNGEKPKGMHWATLDRLQAKHNFYANLSLIKITDYL